MTTETTPNTSAGQGAPLARALPAAELVQTLAPQEAKDTAK